MTVPPPGSPDALAQGCRCPIIDNHYGAGFGEHPESGLPMYVFNADCPMHGGGDWLEGGSDR